jgi:putative peptide maturation system protein
MSKVDETTVIEINGQRITFPEMLRMISWTRRVALIDGIIETFVIKQAAGQLGISISDEELQDEMDHFRTGAELLDIAATEKWLESKYLDYDDLESIIEKEALTKKLREYLVNDKVEQYFALNRLSFDRALISHILADEDLAKELFLQITEEGADFHLLARNYSQDEATRPAGGYYGYVRRSDLDAVLEPLIFGGKAGQIIRPVKSDTGWRIVKVEALIPANLTSEVRAEIKACLFTEWLVNQRAKVKIILNSDSQFAD